MWESHPWVYPCNRLLIIQFVKVGANLSYCITSTG